MRLQAYRHQAFLRRHAQPRADAVDRFSAVPLRLLALAAAGCSSDNNVGKLSCPWPSSRRTSTATPCCARRHHRRPIPTDIAFGVKLTSVQSSCRRRPQASASRRCSNFVIARNDPALRHGDFAYFVAVADARENILAKQNFALRVNFALRQKEVRVVEEITEHLPVKNVGIVGSYGVIVGLQLSQEQLELQPQALLGA